MFGAEFAFGILIGGLIFGVAGLFIGAASQDDPNGPEPGC